MTRHRPRSRLFALAIVLPVLAMLLATTAVAAPNKPIFVDITPVSSGTFDIDADDVAKGTCVLIEVSLRNDTKTQMLGSANYTLDSELIYNAAGCPLNPVMTSASGTPPTQNGLVVELRDLNTAPGGTASFTFSAFVPCTAGEDPVIYDGFSVIAKQANNYSGDPGNNLTTSGDFDIRAVGLCATFNANQTASGDIDGSKPNTEYSVEALNAAAGTLILAKGVNSISCDNYTEHTDTVTVDFTANVAKILTFSFPNATHEQKSAFRVCFASPDDWTDRSGTEITSDTFASLLPDCDDKNDPTNLPCMLPVQIQGQQVTIKAWLRPGDPPGRG